MNVGTEMHGATAMASRGVSQAPYSAEFDQRSRLVAAFSKVVAEHGYADVNIEIVVRSAGLRAADFDEHFSGPEQALVAAQEAFLNRLWLDIENACERAEGWPEKVRNSIAAVLDSLVETSALARVLAIEAPAASLAAAERQFAALNRLAALLRVGRCLYPGAASLPASTERALLGGAVSIVSEHLLAEDPQAIHALRDQLTQLLLAPYLGEEQARRLASGTIGAVVPAATTLGSATPVRFA